MAGSHIQARDTANGERVQANLGAKYHGVVMPDAVVNIVDQLASAAFGAAGQRCMALSVAISVGNAESMLPSLLDKARILK